MKSGKTVRLQNQKTRTCTYAGLADYLKAVDIAKTDEFEMWCWKSLLGIPWTAHTTNVSVLKELNINDRWSTIIRV